MDQVFEKVAGKITESMLTDLCDATNMGNFERTADVANTVSAALATARTIQVKELLKVRRPVDSAPRAYEWGYQATDVARSALGIAHDDPRGSEAFFDRFQLDPGAGMVEGKGSEVAALSLISGAVEREEDNMRVALAGNNRAHRKFAAGRAAFLAWSQGKNSSRLGRRLWVAISQSVIHREPSLGGFAWRYGCARRLPVGPSAGPSRPVGRARAWLVCLSGGVWVSFGAPWRVCRRFGDWAPTSAFRAGRRAGFGRVFWPWPCPDNVRVIVPPSSGAPAQRRGP